MRRPAGTSLNGTSCSFHWCTGAGGTAAAAAAAAFCACRVEVVVVVVRGVGGEQGNAARALPGAPRPAFTKHHIPSHLQVGGDLARALGGLQRCARQHHGLWGRARGGRRRGGGGLGHGLRQRGGSRLGRGDGGVELRC